MTHQTLSYSAALVQTRKLLDYLEQEDEKTLNYVQKTQFLLKKLCSEICVVKFSEE